MNRYSLWKVEPFTKDQPTEIIINKIDQFIKGLNAFYGLVGMERIDMLLIYSYIQDYLKKFDKLKLIDLDRAIELYKTRPVLNKLCPEYFETMFEKYRKSDERKQIYKQWENDTEEHKTELAENNSLTSEQLLNNCYEHWKQTGEILLNSGRVYVENYKLIEDTIGIDTLNVLKMIAQERLIKEHELSIIKMDKKSSLRDEALKILELIKQGKGLVKRETRKEHLKKYFEILIFESN